MMKYDEGYIIENFKPDSMRVNSQKLLCSKIVLTLAHDYDDHVRSGHDHDRDHNECVHVHVRGHNYVCGHRDNEDQ